MHCCSKIALIALALVSVAKWATAAPALRMGMGGSKNNETVSILSGKPRCSDDAQCGPAFRMKTAALLNASGSNLIFGKIRCVRPK